MTPRFEIVEGKRRHCGQMARAMRRDYRSTIEAFGADPHRELRGCFEQSAFCKAWLIDGRLAALGGVIGTLASVEGFVWLALSEEATHYPKAVLQEARRQFEGLLRTKRTVSATILGDAASYRFGRHLGFHVVHPLPFGGEKITRMEACRGVRQNPVMRRDAQPQPFIVFTAGRSRTAWLSSFLTYGDSRCHNEKAVQFEDVEQVVPFFTPWTGTAETGVAPGWRLLKHLVPGIRMVVVRRDIEDVIASFARLEIAPIARIDEEKLRKTVTYGDRCLQRISEQPGVFTVQFKDLDKAATCKDIFEHCLPYQFDFDWWRHLSGRNIQSDAIETVRYYQQHFDAVAKFKRDSKRKLIHLARAGLVSH